MKFMAWIRAVFKCNRLYWLEAFEDVDVDEKVEDVDVDEDIEDVDAEEDAGK